MKRLTKQEEEAMLHIWQLDGAFVKDVLGNMEDDVPYTTLASTIKKLEEKGYVQTKKVGNALYYTPLISEKIYKRTFMKTFVSDYFKNSYKELVNFFVEEEQLSEEELKEIVTMIEEHKTK